ncbi:endonuclease/exonuclease/phosphatase family protein [Amphiplicatus metriothermophilus]
MLAGLAGCAWEAGPAARPAASTVRFATFNAYLNRPIQGQLASDLATSGDVQARKVAEIIQRVAPDILLLNEFDYDPAGEGLKRFRQNYLEVGWNGAPPAVYPYVFLAPSNTGVASGHDLDRDGAVATEPGSRDYGGDAFGYGAFPGQYAMAILSKYPIDGARARTFQTFLWKDMPGALLPDDPATPEPGDWYDEESLNDFRLSSKSHWDVPVIVNGETVHVLASHPTPPTFDGGEDRNGKRNHDEIRFWADYVSEGSGYIYDDEGVFGGLEPGARFVVMGDLNADPHDGGAVAGAIAQLLDHPSLAPAQAPTSIGGAAQAARQGGINRIHRGDPAADTADFGDDSETGPGNLRLDYVLFSKTGFRDAGGGVFWPAPGAAHYDLVGPGYPVESSDHRLVWRDLAIVTE